MAKSSFCRLLHTLYWNYRHPRLQWHWLQLHHPAYSNTYNKTLIPFSLVKSPSYSDKPAYSVTIAWSRGCHCMQRCLQSQWPYAKSPILYTTRALNHLDGSLCTWLYWRPYISYALYSLVASSSSSGVACASLEKSKPQSLPLSTPLHSALPYPPLRVGHLMVLYANGFIRTLVGEATLSMVDKDCLSIISSWVLSTQPNGF